MEKGFYHPDRGYWQTTNEPSQRILDSYPEGTIEVELPPGPNFDYEPLTKKWVERQVDERAEQLERPLTPFQFHAMLGIVGKTDEVSAAIDALPSPDREIAKAKLQHVSLYRLSDPLFNRIRQAINMTQTELEDLWIAALGIE